MNKSKIALLICIISLVSGCRGWLSDKPPIHPNINFDFQAKIKAQSNPLPIPNNTVQYNLPKKHRPLTAFNVTPDFIKNGQKQYNIYCAACHTKTGIGTKSIISKNGWIVSNLLEDITANKTDKELYNIIQNGVRTMPGYGKKLSSKETWQIVLYVRALQKMSRATTLEKRQLKGK
jgi:cytochrome c